MGRSRSLGCCLLLSAAVVAGEASAQGPRSNSKTITWQSPQNSQDIQVGILGEIAAPGVYRVDAASLSVQALVRRAGGLTEEASLSIRIVRQERVVQNLFFSPQADSPLMPGDVLIVESKRALSAMSKVLDGRRPASPVVPAANSPADPTGVQVAYVNVLDAPVVVKLHLDDARLERVVQMLGQPIELTGAVKVIDPQKASHTVAQVASGTLRLTDGSVLIFPKGSINHSRLPALPKPHASEIVTGALPSMIGGPFGQAPELRSVGQMAPLISLPNRDSTSALNTVAAPVIAPPSTIPVAPPVPQFDPQAAPMPIVSGRPRIATLPFTGAAPLRNSSSLGPAESDPIAPPPQDEPQRPSVLENSASRSGPARNTHRSNVAPNDSSIESSLTEPTEPAGASPFTLLQMFGIFAGVSMLIGAALLARRHFDKQATAALPTDTRRDIANPAPASIPGPTPTNSEISHDAAVAAELTPPPATPIEQALDSAEFVSGNKLDRLIRNDLPLREEAVAFPESIVLQGRLASRPIHRIDRAAEHAIGAGPHLATSADSSARASQEAVAMELDAHPSSEARISGPHFGRRRRDTRPITIGDAARAASATPHEAVPPTPLADALRQLEGDRPS